MGRREVACLIALAVIVSAGCVLSAQKPRTVVVKPGQNIQELVESSPQGTRFHFDPGIYRQQTIHPKDRQEFIGQEGVVLTGAVELRTWTKQSRVWKTKRLPRPLPFHGECEDDRDLCAHREDLFFDDRLYKRVESMGDLGPGKWYYKDRRGYLADDPTGQTVELAITPLAFGGDAEDVVLRDLVIEKYATDAQKGAIYADDARGWRISDVTARWNHGAGLSFGPETRVKGGSFSHNGQLGIGASGGTGSSIEGVEIAFNNYAGYNPFWEAGGTKFWATTGLVVRNSCVHHNAGPGLWADNDNIDLIYDGNKVFSNAQDGIKHEISYDAIIRNNIVARNGTGRFDDWLWGSQILIQNSSNVKVYRNLIEVSRKFGNGVGIIHQDRGDGAYGPWDAVNNSVHHNTIVHLGSNGRNGVVADADEDWFWDEADNRFDRNTYIVADRKGKYWTSNDRDEIWDSVDELGFERHGDLIAEERAPMELSCD